MQNKGAVKLFAIVFGLVCLFQLSFTFISYRYSVKADDYANAPAGKVLAAKLAKGDQARLEYLTDSVIRSRNEYFNDSMAGIDVYNILLKTAPQRTNN